MDLDWSEGDVCGILVLIDEEGFDAVDVEDMVALSIAAMIVPELSNRKRNCNNDINALLSVNSCQARAQHHSRLLPIPASL